jgi:hypothetical protein
MKTFFAIPLLFCSLAAHGQLSSGIIAASRATNWSNAGATISLTRTQCVTSSCNTVSGGTVTATSVNAALASAPANTYVLIPAGSFTMNAGLTFNNQSNITLRGSGSNSTFLSWSSTSGGPGNCSLHDVCASSSDTNYAGGPSNTATWTAGYSQGATSITLNSVSGSAPVVGNPIILDQIDVQSDNSALYTGCEISDGSTDCYSGAGPNGFERGNGSLTTIRGQQQLVKVTSISGSGSGPYTVGISPGLYAGNWASGNSPGAWWASHPVQNDAVENISLDHTGGGDGITFFNCQGCWVKGIRSIRNSTTGTGWGHVYPSICNHCTVRDSYFYGYSGDPYGVSVQIASDLLVENNIFQNHLSSQFYNSDCEGCVSDYNFQPQADFGASGSNWLGDSAEFHGIDLYSLAEGNIGSGYYGDSFHGTHDLNTFFRNRWDGHEQNQGSATSSNTIAARMNPGDRYENWVGNILGTIGYHNQYKSTPAGTVNFYTSVYGCGAYPEAGMTGDTLSCPTSMFWGNWDNVTNAVRWCGNSSDPGWGTTCSSTSEVPTGATGYPNTVPSSTTLPASFVYASAPPWWTSGKAWPPIGPDVTGGNVGQCVGGTYATSEATASGQCTGGSFTALATVTSNPAMDCYLNTMGGVANGTGSALTFNAAACYSSTPPPPTTPGAPALLLTVP